MEALADLRSPVPRGDRHNCDVLLQRSRHASRPACAWVPRDLADRGNGGGLRASQRTAGRAYDRPARSSGVEVRLAAIHAEPACAGCGRGARRPGTRGELVVRLADLSFAAADLLPVLPVVRAVLGAC